MMMSIYEPLEYVVIKCCQVAKKESFEQKTFTLKNRKEVLRCDLCPSICRVFNRYIKKRKKNKTSDSRKKFEANSENVHKVFVGIVGIESIVVSFG